MGKAGAIFVQQKDTPQKAKRAKWRRSMLSKVISFGIQVLKTSNIGNIAFQIARQALDYTNKDDFPRSGHMSHLYATEIDIIHQNICRMDNDLSSIRQETSKLLLDGHIRTVSRNVKDLIERNNQFCEDILNTDLTGHLVLRLLCKENIIFTVNNKI